VSQELSELLQTTIDRELIALRAMAVERAAIKPASAGWSPKEELGHLIDSAINNHVRFVRMAFEDNCVFIPYVQDGWVAVQSYNDREWSDLVGFWYAVNAHILAFISNLSKDRIVAKCTIGNEAGVNLYFLFKDYVLHMQHHLDHLLGRAVITPYPSR
jgi:hypothetical protein